MLSAGSISDFPISGSPGGSGVSEHLGSVTNILVFSSIISGHKQNNLLVSSILVFNQVATRVGISTRNIIDTLSFIEEIDTPGNFNKIVNQTLDFAQLITYNRVVNKSVDSAFEFDQDVSFTRSFTVELTDTINFLSIVDRYEMSLFFLSVNNSCLFTQDIEVCNIINIPHYGSVLESNLYFCNIRHGDIWDCVSNTEKKEVLVEATRLIDSLSIAGEKTDPDQCLEYPRDPDLVVPGNIEIATYEIALKLLEETDIDKEIKNLSVTSNRYESVSTDYDRSFIPEHLAAGVPSALAWFLLKPTLNEPRALRTNRVT